MEPAPIILTLGLDDTAQTFFDAQRATHFPKARNFLSAHLTLFHNLPGHVLDEIRTLVAAHAASTPVMRLHVAGLMPLGRGVAYKIECETLKTFYTALQKAFARWLTKQDTQGLRPHITIQNFTPPAEARALSESLSKDFTPFEASGISIRFWYYRGGPWEWIEDIALGS